MQQGQVFPLNSSDGDVTRWAYRYRTGGRGSKRVQRGGFATEQAAVEALERALERLRRERGLVETPTLREFVDVYLAQHGGEPETVEKLAWLLAKSVAVFGDHRLSQLRSPDIAAWRMTVPYGHRFEATQALRQVLNRAVEWALIDSNPAKNGVDNPQRRRVEKRPFESWNELEKVAGKLGGRYGRSSSSPLRLDCGRGSGWRSSGATSIASSGSSMSAATTATAVSSTRRQTRAREQSRSRHAPWPPSMRSLRRDGVSSCFPRWRVATSTCTTSAIATGGRPSSRPESHRSGGSTICATRSRPSRFVPASRPSTSPAIWARA